MKRSLLTLRRVATYRAHTVVPIRNSQPPRCTDRISSGVGKERDSAIEEHASARKGECKALRRMIMLVCLVVYEREKPVLVVSRFCLTSLDSPGEPIERDRADIPLSGEEGQKRRREFCAGYACTRIWERFKATYSRDVLVERGGALCVWCGSRAGEGWRGQRGEREGETEATGRWRRRKREKRKEMRDEREREWYWYSER